MRLTRQQILGGNFRYPQDLISLKVTKHFSQRLEERGVGLECIPTLVRITKDNVHCAKSKDGVRLSSVVVRLEYTKTKHLFLAFSPWDGALKSLWFKEKGYAKQQPNK